MVGIKRVLVTKHDVCATGIATFTHIIDISNPLPRTAKQLDERFQFQKTAMAKQFPLLMKYLWVGAENLKPEETIESVINHGTLGIGFIGLAECLVALIGKHHGESETYYIIKGQGEYDDNGTKRPVTVGDKTFTPDGCGHGIANTGDEDLVFMALIQLD